MFQINQFLDRFKNISNSEKIKKQLVAEILTKNNISVKLEQISFSKTTVFIKVSPIIKTEILLRKEEILSEIKNLPGLGTMSNIQ